MVILQRIPKSKLTTPLSTAAKSESEHWKDYRTYKNHKQLLEVFLDIVNFYPDQIFDTERFYYRITYRETINENT